MNGRWLKGPGAELFHALKARLGHLPIVTENLGVITPEVEAMRKEFNYPGTSALQFAFGSDPQGPSLRFQCVSLTGQCGQLLGKDYIAR